MGPNSEFGREFGPAQLITLPPPLASSGSSSICLAAARRLQAPISSSMLPRQTGSRLKLRCRRWSQVCRLFFDD